MANLTPDELERRASEAEQRFRESIEYVTEDDIEAAARSGEEKIRRLEKAIPQALNALWSDVKLLVSMIRDYGTGAYREVPFATIAAIVAAILYLVSPMDAIPDETQGGMLGCRTVWITWAAPIVFALSRMPSRPPLHPIVHRSELVAVSCPWA